MAVCPDVKEHVWDSEIARAGVQPEVVELLVSALATLLELEHGLVPDFLALRLLVESKVMTALAPSPPSFWCASA